MMSNEMILQIHKMQDLNFEKLMCVYEEGNRENGRYFYSRESEAEQLRLAKQDFYDYLQNDFFRVVGAKYWILQADNRYVCALRTEPFQDGYLLEALETAPDMRRRGYAGRLVEYVMAEMRKKCSLPVYSHVSKRNFPSLAVHERCGFVKALDHAVYLDGSVSSDAVTLAFR